MKFPSVIFLTLLLCTNSYAKTIGTITKLKGQATILEIGHREASNLQLGSTVSKDASILTMEKSFVQITLQDKTTINLGPKSKIILDQSPVDDLGEVGIVNLMMGKIRSEVTHKQVRGKEKLFIKTRTAALGVRGTDFQTIYNPENKITSLITFDGKVAMAKAETPIEKISTNDLKEATLVEKGRFSTVSENLQHVTEPVKISPVQYTGLKINKEMTEDKKVDTKEFEQVHKETIAIYQEISKEETKQGKTAARKFDVDDQTYRPTAGGVVDLNTGIYVPPTMEEKNFNKKLNIYEIKDEKGTVSSNGTYVPPAGVVLDAKKGFVVADSKKVNSQSLEVAKDLNQEISGQINKPKKPSLEDLEKIQDVDSYDKYYHIE